MQSQAQSISVKSKEEHAEVEDDLAKMAKLVYDFQVRRQHVYTPCKLFNSTVSKFHCLQSQVSQVLGKGWEVAMTGSPEQASLDAEHNGTR